MKKKKIKKKTVYKSEMERILKKYEQHQKEKSQREYDI